VDRAPAPKGTTVRFAEAAATHAAVELKMVSVQPEKSGTPPRHAEPSRAAEKASVSASSAAIADTASHNSGTRIRGRMTGRCLSSSQYRADSAGSQTLALKSQEEATPVAAV
jgi:hypothetical protein